MTFYHKEHAFVIMARSVTWVFFLGGRENEQLYGSGGLNVTIKKNKVH